MNHWITLPHSGRKPGVSLVVNLGLVEYVNGDHDPVRDATGKDVSGVRLYLSSGVALRVNHPADLAKLLAALDRTGVKSALPTGAQPPLAAPHAHAVLAALDGLLDGLTDNGAAEHNDPSEWTERIQFARQALTNAELAMGTAAGKFPPRATAPDPNHPSDWIEPEAEEGEP